MYSCVTVKSLGELVRKNSGDYLLSWMQKFLGNLSPGWWIIIPSLRNLFQKLWKFLSRKKKEKNWSELPQNLCIKTRYDKLKILLGNLLENVAYRFSMVSSRN